MPSNDIHELPASKIKVACVSGISMHTLHSEAAEGSCDPCAHSGVNPLLVTHARLALTSCCRMMSSPCIFWSVSIVREACIHCAVKLFEDLEIPLHTMVSINCLRTTTLAWLAMSDKDAANPNLLHCSML